MKKFPVFGIVMLAVFFSWGEVSSTTYYVSKTGNDANSGLDTANAWATINHAAQTLQAGDTVLIMEGRYYESNIIPANSGTYSNRIVYKAYPGADVWIDAQHSIHHVWRFGKDHQPDSARNYITVDSVNIVNSGDVTKTNDWGGQAIFIWECKKLEFKNCVICSTQGDDNVGAFFIQFSDSITIKNCTIFHNREDTLAFEPVKMNNTGITIYGSSSHDPTPRRTREIRIENCEFYDMNVGIKYKEPGEPGHFYCLNNKIHDIIIGIHARYDSTIVKNNLIYDGRGSESYGIQIGFDLGDVTGGDYSKVEHNTVVNMTQASISIPEESPSNPPGGANGVTVKNNICYIYGGYRGLEMWTENPDASQPDSYYVDYNCYYDASEYIQQWNHYTNYTLSGIRTSKGCEIHGMKADPMFVDPASDDYRLREGSPCIRAADDGGDIGALPYDGWDDTNPPYIADTSWTSDGNLPHIHFAIRDKGIGVDSATIVMKVDFGDGDTVAVHPSITEDSKRAKEYYLDYTFPTSNAYPVIIRATDLPKKGQEVRVMCDTLWPIGQPGQPQWR